MQKRTTRRCHMKINIAVILLPYWILQVLKRPPTCIGLKVPLLSLIMIIHVSYVQNFTVDTRPKIWPIWFYHRAMSPKDADRNANSVDPDQTLHCLPRLVRKLRIITVIYHFIVMVTNSTIKKTWLSMHFSEMPDNKVIGCKVDLSCQKLQVYLNGNWIIIPRTSPWCSTSLKHFLSGWQSVRPSACPILLIEHITIIVTTSLWIFLIYLRPRKKCDGVASRQMNAAHGWNVRRD